jgi:hypothetical protein
MSQYVSRAFLRQRTAAPPTWRSVYLSSLRRKEEEFNAGVDEGFDKLDYD